ncbi:MAG: ATPase, T2SS/T4P/T4SS family, partial [Fervidicoccaceae archaeon]
ERVLSTIIKRSLGEASSVQLTPNEAYYVERISSGLGPLYPILADRLVEDVALDGPNEALSVFHKHIDGWLKSNVILDELSASLLAKQLARMIGKPLSPATPIAEGVTREGHRVAIALGSDVSRKGTSFVIRRGAEPPSLAQLIASGMLSPLMASYLWLLAELRGFLMIIGGMAAGKTTLLQALLNMLPSDRRVVTIEDTPELRLFLENWDPLVVRSSYHPGGEAKELDLVAMTKFALRRRAEHLVIGEVRGEEARVLAQAAATGHGSLCVSEGHSVVIRAGEGERRIRIDELFDKVARGALSPKGLRILAHCPRRRGVLWAEIRALVRTRCNVWIKLRTSGGATLRASPDHVLLSSDGKVLRFRRAEELRRGDELLRVELTPENKPWLDVIEDVEIEERRGFAYDIEVPGPRTYVVESVVSHNCTFHANDVNSAIFRLMSEPISLGPSFISLIWAFAEVRSLESKGRRIVRVVEVLPEGPEGFSLRELFSWKRESDSFEPTTAAEVVAKSSRLRLYASLEDLSESDLVEELNVRTELLSSLSKRGVGGLELREYLRGFYELTRRSRALARSALADSS